MTKHLIPPDALNQHVAVLGKTGSGKSYAAKGIVEGLLDQKRQVCVLDPTGAWWGLRLAADGKGKGYDVILLGGAHGDIPLSERSGTAVARLVTQQGASVVIDTSAMTVGEYTRWFIDFAGTLYTTIKNPLHLVIDEAHYFMPQGKSPDVDAGRMLHAGNRLMSGGRSKGVRGILISQRPAKLHKDSLTCADTLIAMRMIAPQDRSAVKEWIDGAGDPVKGKAVLDSLASLARGQGWVWYPEGGHLELTTFPKIKTYDSSATPTHGAKAGPEVGQIDLDEVRIAMRAAVEEAEANDPKHLRKTIAELRAELAKKPAAASPAKPLIQSDTKAIERAVSAAVAARDKHWRGEAAKLSGELAKSHRTIGRIKGLLDGFETTPFVMEPPKAAMPPVTLNGHAPAKTTVSDIRNPTAPSARYDGEPIGSGERAILTACAQYPDGCDREQLSILAGYKRSTRDAYLQRLCFKGLISTDEPFTATEAGLALLGDFEPLPTGDALLRHWIRELPEGERKCLEVVAAAWPERVSRDDVTESTGYKRSTRDAYLQRLGTRKLITTTRDGVVASDLLFDGATT